LLFTKHFMGWFLSGKSWVRRVIGMGWVTGFEPATSTSTVQNSLLALDKSNSLDWQNRNKTDRIRNPHSAATRESAKDNHKGGGVPDRARV